MSAIFKSTKSISIVIENLFSRFSFFEYTVPFGNRIKNYIIRDIKKERKGGEERRAFAIYIIYLYKVCHTLSYISVEKIYISFINFAW